MSLALSGYWDCGLRGGLLHRAAGLSGQESARVAAAAGLRGAAGDECGVSVLPCRQRARGQSQPALRVQEQAGHGGADSAVAVSL